VAPEIETADVVMRLVSHEGRLNDDACRCIRDVILNPHKHKHRKANKKYGGGSTQQQYQNGTYQSTDDGEDTIGISLFLFSKFSIGMNTVTSADGRRQTTNSKARQSSNVVV
jgi:hypothetical protein